MTSTGLQRMLRHMWTSTALETLTNVWERLDNLEVPYFPPWLSPPESGRCFWSLVVNLTLHSLYQVREGLESFHRASINHFHPGENLSQLQREEKGENQNFKVSQDKLAKIELQRKNELKMMKRQIKAITSDQGTSYLVVIKTPQAIGEAKIKTLRPKRQVAGHNKKAMKERLIKSFETGHEQSKCRYCTYLENQETVNQPTTSRRPSYQKANSVL